MEDAKVTHLPEMLHAVTGVPRSRIRRDIAMGEVKVNGKPWTDMDLPDDAIEPGGYVEHPYREQVIERQRRGLI